MNEEQEMTPAAEQQDPAPEVEENAANDGEISNQAESEIATEQEPDPEPDNGAEAENQPDTPPNSEAIEDEEDGYDDFYHDMSDFEQESLDEASEEDNNEDNDEDEDDGGNTPSDPEGEDEDEGENEADKQPPEDNAEQEEQPETGAETPEQDNASETEPVATDYGAWEKEDREAILAAHPELKAVLEGKHLRDVLDDPGLFGYMRGSAETRAKYSAVEAFEKASAQMLAKRAADARAKQNSKQHIRSSSGKAAAPPDSIPSDMMRQLREMFPDKTRDELVRLYKTVT